MLYVYIFIRKVGSCNAAGEVSRVKSVWLLPAVLWQKEASDKISHLDLMLFLEYVGSTLSPEPFTFIESAIIFIRARCQKEASDNQFLIYFGSEKHVTLPRQIGASANDCTERTVVKGSSCISESQCSLHFVASQSHCTLQSCAGWVVCLVNNDGVE